VLWDLVWAGVVTNDTFAPLRNLLTGGASGRRTRRVSAGAGFGGRWSLVGELIGATQAPATERAHALAVSLLERWGIASRDAAAADAIAGGFGAVADVLRAMEDAGTVRRGYFVDGLAGAQYAWPGAIDALRSAPKPTERAVVLAAVDPASPWGAVLPWPPLRDDAARPARRTGASTIQIAGRLVAWVEPRARRVATSAIVSDDAIAPALIDGLARLAADARRRELLVETIDGKRAAESPWADALVAAGARLDYRGLVVTARG
jgi:ATP-dependent Lhr-like helicase